MTMPCETKTTGPAMDMAQRIQAQLPVLETARLRLRAPCIEDFGFYVEIVAGPRGVHILEDASRENAWFDFTQMIASWTLRGFGLWTVETRAEDTVAGFVLLGFEPGDHEPELGYMFRAEFEGQGLAAEAAITARNYAFETLHLRSVVSTIEPANQRSCRLAERLGASRDASAEAAHGNSILVYRHNAPDTSSPHSKGMPVDQ